MKSLTRHGEAPATVVAILAGFLALLLGGAVKGAPPGAERVVLKFSGSNIQMITALQLEKTLSPSDELPQTQRPISGFWYELRAASGAVRYRKIIGDPIRNRVEGPALDGQNTSPVPKFSIPQERVFSVLIPRSGQGDELVIFSSPLREGGESEPAQEIARISLRGVIIK
jgi:hypothetical protein